MGYDIRLRPCGGCGQPLGTVSFSRGLDASAEIVCEGCYASPLPGRPGDRMERCSRCARPFDGPPFVSPDDTEQDRPLCGPCWQTSVEEGRRLADLEARRLAMLGPRLLAEAACLLRAWDELPALLPSRIEALRTLVQEARAA